jgi:MarR family transcriptional repressor of emrRAB
MPGDLVLLSRLFGHVYMRLENAFDTLMARWELSAWSWLTLMIVHSRKGEEVTPSDLSRVLFLARANVTRVTDELVRRGYLHREPSTRDRRVLNLSMTAAGEGLVAEIMPHAWELHRSIWSEVPAGQLDAVQEMLCAVLQGVEAWPGAGAGASAARTLTAESP